MRDCKRTPIVPLLGSDFSTAQYAFGVDVVIYLSGQTAAQVAGINEHVAFDARREEAVVSYQRNRKS